MALPSYNARMRPETRQLLELLWEGPQDALLRQAVADALEEEGDARSSALRAHAPRSHAEVLPMTGGGEYGKASGGPDRITLPLSVALSSLCANVEGDTKGPATLEVWHAGRTALIASWQLSNDDHLYFQPADFQPTILPKGIFFSLAAQGECECRIAATLLRTNREAIQAVITLYTPLCAWRRFLRSHDLAPGVALPTARPGQLHVPA